MNCNVPTGMYFSFNFAGDSIQLSLVCLEQGQYEGGAGVLSIEQNMLSMTKVI